MEEVVVAVFGTSCLEGVAEEVVAVFCNLLLSSVCPDRVAASDVLIPLDAEEGVVEETVAAVSLTG